MQFKKFPRRRVFINIASLTDLVFLLIIFFTVSMRFMDQPALKIDLPQASAETLRDDEQKPMTVYLTKEGELYFRDKPIRLDDLPGMIKADQARHQSNRLTIKADRDVTHGRVIEVMDLARQNGIEMVTIATQKRAEQKKQ
jgi:biopolymer transport protein ExbD